MELLGLSRSAFHNDIGACLGFQIPKTLNVFEVDAADISAANDPDFSGHDQLAGVGVKGQCPENSRCAPRERIHSFTISKHSQQQLPRSFMCLMKVKNTRRGAATLNNGYWENLGTPLY